MTGKQPSWLSARACDFVLHGIENLSNGIQFPAGAESSSSPATDSLVCC